MADIESGLCASCGDPTALRDMFILGAPVLLSEVNRIDAPTRGRKDFKGSQVSACQRAILKRCLNQNQIQYFHTKYQAQLAANQSRIIDSNGTVITERPVIKVRAQAKKSGSFKISEIENITFQAPDDSQIRAAKLNIGRQILQHRGNYSQIADIIIDPNKIVDNIPTDPTKLPHQTKLIITFVVMLIMQLLTSSGSLAGLFTSDSSTS